MNKKNKNNYIGIKSSEIDGETLQRATKRKHYKQKINNNNNTNNNNNK